MPPRRHSLAACNDYKGKGFALSLFFEWEFGVVVFFSVVRYSTPGTQESGYMDTPWTHPWGLRYGIHAVEGPCNRSPAFRALGGASLQ